MDIQVASNFERYLFELAGRDPALLHAWMAAFERSGTLRIPPERFARVTRDLLSAAVSEDETLATIRDVQARHGYLLDPHSAVGFCAAQRSPGAEEIPTICMATAHPAKFGAAIRRATGADPELPPALAGLERLPARVSRLPAQAERVKAHLLGALHLAAEPDAGSAIAGPLPAALGKR